MTNIKKNNPDNRRAVNTLLSSQKSEIRKALAGAMDVDKFIRVAMTAYAKGDKSIATSDPVSVLGAVISAAQLGLSLDPLTGEAYVVARWNKHRNCNWATLMIGYQGLMKRARASKEIAYFDAGVVYAGDTFEVQIGTEPTLLHDRNLDPTITDEPDVIATYAIAHFRGDERFRRIYVCPRWEVDKAMSRSGSGQYGPWKTDYAAMAQKTALRRLMKLCPMDDVTRAALSAEEGAETGEMDLGSFGYVSNDVAEPGEAPQPNDEVSALKDRVRESAEAEIVGEVIT